MFPKTSPADSRCARFEVLNQCCAKNQRYSSAWWQLAGIPVPARAATNVVGRASAGFSTQGWRHSNQKWPASAVPLKL